MATLLYLISAIAGLVSVICFVLLVVKMFNAGDAGMGILCLVLCLCGIGFFVALILGWINVDKYGARKLMPIYTVAFILTAVLGGTSGYMYRPAIDARHEVPSVQAV